MCPVSSNQRATELVERFLEALRAGSSVAANSVVDEALRDGIEAVAAQSRVIEPAMDRVGELWQEGEMNVADEHLATAISNVALARLFPRLLIAPARSRERVLLAAVEGEHHVLGLRMVADVLEGAGFDVLYLGADVPSDALLSACKTRRPAVLGLSVTMGLNVPALILLLAELQAMDERPAVFVGGQATAAAIDRGLRVTVVEHSEDVVELVEALLVRPPAWPLVPQDLLSRVVPAGPAGAPAGEAWIGTIPDAFSATTLAATDAVRDAARRAFEVEQMAYRDPVTGLWNRRAYEERLHKLVEGGLDGFAVLMLDVDSFRAINDRYGFEAGTLGLLAVARSIARSVRAAVFVARVGGDEFAVLVPDTPSSLAVAMADAIRGAVGRKVTDPPLTVSVGVTVFHDSIRATSLAAEQALDRAKRMGGNRVALQEP